ncbi:hypothetical protein B0T17DRAFT_406139 [Bombardia bombarda]|uniref:Uncharacterized protein n=1 Tax=Bombardia bombarda TaxID=252184 RepID=A0AA39WBJ3_9PEZI|nr:hypothetical protein B0T17DRAFT_406139 [Bombardia bombarda]
MACSDHHPTPVWNLILGSGQCRIRQIPSFFTAFFAFSRASQHVTSTPHGRQAETIIVTWSGQAESRHLANKESCHRSYRSHPHRPVCNSLESIGLVVLVLILFRLIACGMSQMSLRMNNLPTMQSLTCLIWRGGWLWLDRQECRMRMAVRYAVGIRSGSGTCASRSANTTPTYCGCGRKKKLPCQVLWLTPKPMFFRALYLSQPLRAHAQPWRLPCQYLLHRFYLPIPPQ